MIFITVGTHEQPFDRLLKYIDRLVDDKIIQEEIICQSGYSTYSPTHFKTTKFLNRHQMQNALERARIVITHGGPSSFMSALALNKTPIVVPRLKQYNEHVNNHQLDFCSKVERTQHSIILATNYTKLKTSVQNFDLNSASNVFQSHNQEFCDKLLKLIKEGQHHA